MARLGEVNYKIQRSPSSKAIVVHVDHLKPFHSHNTPAAWESFTDPAVMELNAEQTHEDAGHISEEGDVENLVD